MSDGSGVTAPEPYVPPSTREEAGDEIMRTGFTIPALMAVDFAFPLPTSLEELKRLGPDLLPWQYFSEACGYLEAWGRGSCDLPRA